jgi:hypothetical protein
VTGVNPQTRFYRTWHAEHYRGRRARMARIRRERIAYQSRLRRQWRRERTTYAAA